MKKIIICILAILFMCNLSSCTKETKPLEDGTYEITYPEI